MRESAREREWIYGVNAVTEALRSGRSLDAIFFYNQQHPAVQRVLSLARQEGIKVQHEDKSFFDSRFPKGHQGIAAQGTSKQLLPLESLLEIPQQKGEPAFFIILDEVEDPRNFGALLRAADAAGVHGVVFQSHRSAGITHVVSKSSAGALEHVPLSEVVNIKHAINEMKEHSITIIGAEAGSPAAPWDIDMAGPLALVVGSEGHGLRKTVRDHCDYIVSLPMRGRVNSLNVSVATGIVAYEVVRQRSPR